MKAENRYTAENIFRTDVFDVVSEFSIYRGVTEGVQ